MIGLLWNLRILLLLTFRLKLNGSSNIVGTIIHGLQIAEHLRGFLAGWPQHAWELLLHKIPLNFRDVILLVRCVSVYPKRFADGLHIAAHSIWTSWIASLGLLEDLGIAFENIIWAYWAYLFKFIAALVILFILYICKSNYSLYSLCLYCTCISRLVGSALLCSSLLYQLHQIDLLLPTVFQYFVLEYFVDFYWRLLLDLWYGISSKLTDLSCVLYIIERLLKFKSWLERNKYDIELVLVNIWYILEFNIWSCSTSSCHAFLPEHMLQLLV